MRRLRSPVGVAVSVVVVALFVAWSGESWSRASLGDSPPAQPKTLVSVSGGVSDVGPIYGFALDGNVLVWAAEEGGGTCPPIRMRDLSGRDGVVIGQAGGLELCDEYGFWIAVGGTRALWAGFKPANHPFGTVVTGGLGRRPQQVEGLSNDYSEAGDFVIDVVGDGPTLAYATLFVEPNDWDACFPGYSPREKTCAFRVSEGSVKRVAGNKAVAIPGVPPSMAIAASSGRLAIVPADLRWGHEFHARVNGPVEIRDANTGRLSRRVQPRGEVKAVALSEAVVAVLVREGRTLRLEAYDVRTGTRRSSVRVGAKSGYDIDAAGTVVVYSDQKAIRILQAGKQTTSLVAIASTEPLDLSIEGSRIAWYENRNEGREGRIQSIELH